MKNLSTLNGLKALVNSTLPTGCFISTHAQDIRTACLTGFWDTKCSPNISTGLFQIMGNKAVRNSADPGGVLTFEIEEAVTGGTFSDNRWADPLKIWPTRLYFKCNTGGFSLIEYRTMLNELELELYGKNCAQSGFVYVNKQLGD